MSSTFNGDGLDPYSEEAARQAQHTADKVSCRDMHQKKKETSFLEVKEEVKGSTDEDLDKAMQQDEYRLAAARMGQYEEAKNRQVLKPKVAFVEEPKSKTDVWNKMRPSDYNALIDRLTGTKSAK